MSAARRRGRDRLLAAAFAASAAAVVALAPLGHATSVAAAFLAAAAAALAARAYGLGAEMLERTEPPESSAEREEARRREGEIVLRFVVEEAPSAVVLLTSTGKVLLANALARSVFFDGQDVVGRSFIGLLGRAPEVLQRALSSEGDEILSVEDAEGTPKTVHLRKRHLTMSGEPVILVVLDDLTREIGRREVDVWKQVIRVIAHEVNNSLAPISTLASTGRVLSRGTAVEDTLLRVFDTVAGRAVHLGTFLEGYARLARLPPPERRSVSLRMLAERIDSLWPGIVIEGDLTAPDGWFDLAQVEQLLLNLLKNASEAGSAREEIVMAVDGSDPRFVRITVRDRGRGMTGDVMKRAMLPLFSTKSGGRGIGLALCREIAEAHDGTMRIGARDGGGVEVSVRLPRERRGPPDSHPSMLSLSRGV